MTFVEEYGNDSELAICAFVKQMHFEVKAAKRMKFYQNQLEAFWTHIDQKKMILG